MGLRRARPLVLNPADDYVTAFTAHVPRAKVVTLGRIAAPGLPDAVAGTLPADARIDAVAEQIVSANAAFPVERDGAIIGHVTPEAIIAILIGKRT